MTHSHVSGQGEQPMPIYESFAHQCLLCVQVLGNGQAKCIRDFLSRRVKRRVQSLQAESLSLAVLCDRRVEGMSGHGYFFTKEG